MRAAAWYDGDALSPMPTAVHALRRSSVPRQQPDRAMQWNVYNISSEL